MIDPRHRDKEERTRAKNRDISKKIYRLVSSCSPSHSPQRHKTPPPLCPLPIRDRPKIKFRQPVVPIAKMVSRRFLQKNCPTHPDNLGDVLGSLRTLWPFSITPSQTTGTQRSSLFFYGKCWCGLCAGTSRSCIFFQNGTYTYIHALSITALDEGADYSSGRESFGVQVFSSSAISTKKRRGSDPVVHTCTCSQGALDLNSHGGTGSVSTGVMVTVTVLLFG